MLQDLASLFTSDFLSNSPMFLQVCQLMPRFVGSANKCQIKSKKKPVGSWPWLLVKAAAKAIPSLESAWPSG